MSETERTHGMKFSDFIEPGAITAQLAAEDKESVIAELVGAEGGS